MKLYGSQAIVYIDELGFQAIQACIYAWSKKGKGKKDLIAPMVFSRSLNVEGFERWLSLYLLPSLRAPSILIMDKAPIHRKTAIKELAKKAGHEVLFLVKYSPIEHDFDAVKRARMYTPIDASLDEIICSYCES